MRIIITGATSFVGSAAAREFLRRNHQVAAVIRPHSSQKQAILKGNEQALWEKRLFVIENDLGEPQALGRKLEEAFGEETMKADVFCHFGWGGSGSGSRTDSALQERNLKNSLEIMKAAAGVGCQRFLFSGSQAEYGFHQEPMTEETACCPRSAYGEAKLAMAEKGRELAKALGMEYVHGRIFSAYGPGDHPWTLVESCLDAFLSGGIMKLGACTQQWNFLYIKDLAEGICDLAEVSGKALAAAGSPVFNLAGTETRQLKTFVEEIHKLAGGRGNCCFRAREENAEGLVNLIPSIKKMEAVAGWVPKTSFREGIRKTIESRQTGADY